MERKLMRQMEELTLCPAQWPHQTQMHTAIIMKGNQVIARGINRVGSRSRGCGQSDRMIHAEKSAIKNLGDINRLKGAVLCVWRVSTKSLLPSKPCHECENFLRKCMREQGLKAVQQTDTERPWYHEEEVAPPSRKQAKHYS